MKSMSLCLIVLLSASVALGASKDFKITNRLEDSKKARVVIEKGGTTGVLNRTTLSKGDSKSFDFSAQNGGIRVSVYNDATNERMVDRADFRGNEEVEIQTVSKDSNKWKVVRK